MLRRGFSGMVGVFGSGHGFNSPLLYSTSTASKDGLRNPFLVDYLVQSLGFSEEEAIPISARLNSPLKSTKGPELVVHFLKESGFDDNHIRKLVSSFPSVLFKDIERILKPKIRAFQDLGLSGLDLGTLLSDNPYVFSRGLKTHIIPALETLKSFLSSNENLVKAMLRSQWVLSPSGKIRKNMLANVSLLRTYGIPKEKIELFFLLKPKFLLHRPEWVENAAKRVEEKLGIPRTSGTFLHGVCALASTTEEKIELRIGVFRGYGWSESDISEMSRRHPLCLTMSEKAIRARLDYFMKELGYGSYYLATHPALLTHSFEKKVLPRNAVLQVLREKQLLKFDVCLYTILHITESSFLKKYVLPFRDEVPELYDYVNKVKR